MSETNEERWGLFCAPERWERGEAALVRSGVPLPKTWRGFVSEHATRQEAFDAWSEGLFARELARSGGEQGDNHDES